METSIKGIGMEERDMEKEYIIHKMVMLKTDNIRMVKESSDNQYKKIN